MLQVGDIVRLKTGKSPQKVIEVDRSRKLRVIRAQYLSRMHNHDRPRWRDESDYILIHEKEPEPMNQLYQTIDAPPRFGTRIATNSKGQYVLEMKDQNGGVEAFHPHSLEEVMPFTIELSLLGGDRSTSKSIVAHEGQVEKDEILLELNTGQIWRVTQLNSKARSPKENKSKWLKIPSAIVTFGAFE